MSTFEGNVAASLDPEEVDEEDADHAAVEAADEQHGHDEAAGDVRAGRPARHHEVDDEHGRHRAVGELPVRVLGEQVVDRLRARAQQQSTRITPTPF